MKKLLLIVSLLLSLSAMADESMYKPVCSPDICLMKNPKVQNKNWILLQTGMGLAPYKLSQGGVPYNPSGNTFALSYFRIVKEDLAIGGTLDADERGPSGFKVGFGLGF